MKLIVMKYNETSTAQKMKFLTIRRNVRIWSHLLKTSLLGGFIFGTVQEWGYPFGTYAKFSEKLTFLYR